MTKVEYSHIKNLLNSLEYKFERVGETTVTGCWAFLPNGFQVGYGESACVDPSNYNQADGEKYAKERCQQAATNKLWELEGYLLKVAGKTSDKINQVEPCHLRGFKSFASKPVTRFAYEVKDDDLFEVIDETTMTFVVDGIERQFKHYEPVKPGDFIVFLKDDDIYHCRRDVFADRNHI